MDMPKVSPAKRICLVNGVPATEVSIQDRGLAYGDGLFETIRVSGGRPSLRDYHLNRLNRGAVRLQLPIDFPQIESEIDSLAADIGIGVLKLIVTRGDSGRGYVIPQSQQPTRILQTAPLPNYPEQHAEQGIRLYPCRTRLGHQPLLAGLKHLNRLEQVLARSEWQDPAYAEGLMCDLNDNPIEGTMSNIFARMDHGWVTPSLDQCGVAGVMRDFLIDELGREQPLVVKTLSRAELLGADEVFCCNSVFGVWPVIGLEEHQWPIGPHTRYAQILAEQVFN